MYGAEFRLDEVMTTVSGIDSATLAGTWTLDPAHSELGFVVRHLMISKVKGFFRDFEVTVTVPEDPAQASIDVSINVASVDTNNEMRDGHLRTGDFFLVEEHPAATFRATKISGTPEALTIDGDLTVRGVTKPVTLTGEFNGVVTDAGGTTKAVANVSTTINRLDFGVNWNAALEAGGMTLADEVTINADLQLAKQG